MTPNDPRHGQERGWFAHRAAGQDPCEPCRAARRRASKLRDWNRANGRGAMQSAIGTRRRIQALVALGWPMSRLDREAGRGNKWARNILYVNGEDTYLPTRVQVAALYDRLHMRPPVATTRQEQAAITRARGIARANGWPAPLDWHDFDIDDPDQHPGRNDERLARRTADSLLDEWQWLIDNGESAERAAERVGLKPKAIEKALRRRKAA
jgi:hypothetical protein